MRKIARLSQAEKILKAVLTVERDTEICDEAEGDRIVASLLYIMREVG